MKNLAEIQMMSLALAGDWDGVEKIAKVVRLDALITFADTCERLYYRCGSIVGSRQIARAKRKIQKK